MCGFRALKKYFGEAKFIKILHTKAVLAHACIKMTVINAITRIKQF